MDIYKSILHDILDNGVLTDNRTGIPTISLFGRQYRYLLYKGFPILTTRHQDFKKIVTELLWFIRGSGNCDYLDEHNVKLWKAWTDPESNSIGPLYPVQWRNYESITRDKEGNFHVEYIDQLQNTIDNIRNHPFSRRHVVSTWNPTYLPDESISPIENVKLGKQALPPCHTLFQFTVRKINLLEALNHPDNLESLCDFCGDLVKEGKIKVPNPTVPLRVDNSPKRVELCAKLVRDYVRDNPEVNWRKYHIKQKALTLQLYQRSWDVGAAGGWNVSQYALLLHMVAKVTGLIPYDFVHSIGDLHIYEDQIPVLSEQLQREPYPLPKLVIHGNQKEIDDFEIDDFELIDYKYHGKLKIPVAT